MILISGYFRLLREKLCELGVYRAAILRLRLRVQRPPKGAIMPAIFRNPVNGYEEKVRLAWLWCLLFCPLYFTVNGVWPHALISWFTMPVTWLIYPFFAKGIIKRNYLRKGWIEVSAK